MKLIAMRNIGTPNKNGRTYSLELVEKMISDKKVDVDGNRLFMEKTTDFPFSGGSVDLENVAGLVKSMVIENNSLVCDVEFLDIVWRDGTMTKSEIESLLKSGMLSIVPRGMGNIDKNGIISNYELISFTLTNDPA